MVASTRILTFRHNGKVLREVFPTAGQTMSIAVGSQAASVDVCLPSPRISRIHAQVLVDEGGQVFVVDPGSTNGTFVNGQRLAAGQPCAVRPGDRIEFAEQAGAFLEIAQAAAKQAAAPSPVRTPTPVPVPAHAPTSESMLLQLKQKGELVIGRQADCDILLDSTTVSRHHAVLRLLPDESVVLTDLNSTNGTFLNGQRISGSAKVGPEDVILIGRMRLALDSRPQNLSSEVAIRTVSIEKRFSNGKIGLRETSVAVRAGSLVAIMGPSGCGKSTLLKCLTGESPATRGKVLLHNLELLRNYEFLKPLIGYVPQDDSVHKELTVSQALYFAARLRMERPTAEEIAQKIQAVTQRLNIAHVLASPITKISGGQRKRVSIAVELLTDPLILFLDEPTSPLDPQTIAEFMGILQDLARSGTTVVMVTHKPEDLEFMDEVIFMAEGGSLAYQGPVGEYKQYFGVRTAVEVYAALCGKGAEAWVKRFHQGQSLQTPGSVIDHPRLRKRGPRSSLAQTWWLGRRYLRIKTNDLLNLALLIGQAPIIALLVCLIFDEVTRAVPFLVTLSAAWFGTSNAARELVGEAAIYRRERMYNLRIGPYLASKLVVLAGFALVQAVLFSFILNLRYQDAYPAWQELGGTIGWVWLITMTATALGLMISALVNTVEKAMTIVPLVLIPQVMLAGVVAPFATAGVELLSYLSPTRWGNEGLMLLQGEIYEAPPPLPPEFGGVISPVLDAESALKPQYFETLYEDIFGESSFTIGLNASMLTGLGLLLLIGVAFTLWWKEWRRE
jgi:ABC-type multidrug transport system ATPase subunit/pSer/pThr/pTyr-binding forkhead associated (FHA) protein